MGGLRLLSPRGEGALALLSVGRSEAKALLESLGVADPPQPGRMRLVDLCIPVEGQEPLVEEALLVGTEAEVELQIHGNPLLVRLLEELAPATPPRGAAAHLEEQLGRARSRCALAFALVQSEPGGLLDRMQACAEGRATAIEDWEGLLAQGRRARALFEPSRIVVRGPVNVGKSTLLNRLLGRKRIRVGSRPGLTRDPVEVELLHRERRLLLIDTAGEAEGLGGLDTTAIASGREEAEEADLVLEVRSVQATGEAGQAACGKGPCLWIGTQAPSPGGRRGEPVTEGFDLVGDLAAEDFGREAWLDRILEALGQELEPPIPGPGTLDAEDDGYVMRILEALRAGETEAARAAAGSWLASR